VKAGLSLVAVGLLALLAQGVAAFFVPARLLPDLGLLVVFASAVSLRSTSGGVLLAALLGYTTDCLAGSLLGQHMLLSMAAYGAARAGATRLNLRGPLPQAIFAAFLASAHAAALWALVAFFDGWLGPPLALLAELAPHALVTGLAAPFVTEGVARLLAALGEDEGGRPLRLEPRALAP
jgi:rod shape-determining protein MreD